MSDSRPRVLPTIGVASGPNGSAWAVRFGAFVEADWKARDLEGLVDGDAWAACASPCSRNVESRRR